MRGIPFVESGLGIQPGTERPEGAGIPAILVNAVAAVVVEILDVFVLRRLRVGEAGGHADAVDGVLRETVHFLRGLDADHVIERRGDVVDVIELRARRLVGLDLLRPGNDERIARAAEVSGDEFRGAERRAAGPGPAGVIDVVGQRAAERFEAAEFVERLDLLGDGVGDLVLREQFADRAVLTFGGGAIVAPEVEDDRVVALAGLVEEIHQLADLGVGVFAEAGVEFHQTRLESAFRFGDVRPGGHGRVARREFGVGGNPAERFLAGEDFLAKLVPALVELAFVFVGPCRGDVVRPVDAAGCPVHEERFVRGEMRDASSAR